MVKWKEQREKGTLTEDGDRLPNRLFPSGMRKWWEKRAGVFPGAAWVLPCGICAPGSRAVVGLSSPLIHGGAES